MDISNLIGIAIFIALVYFMVNRLKGTDAKAIVAGASAFGATKLSEISEFIQQLF